MRCQSKENIRSTDIDNNGNDDNKITETAALNPLLTECQDENNIHQTIKLSDNVLPVGPRSCKTGPVQFKGNWAFCL